MELKGIIDKRLVFSPEEQARGWPEELPVRDAKLYIEYFRIEHGPYLDAANYFAHSNQELASESTERMRTAREEDIARATELIENIPTGWRRWLLG